MGKPSNADFSNLVFWDAVRNHPDFHLDVKVAKEMSLDPTKMLETHQQRVQLYAKLADLSVEQAKAEILTAATTYNESLKTARTEWEKLLVSYNGKHWHAGPKAMNQGWLVAFCTDGGMDQAQAVAFLCWSTI